MDDWYWVSNADRVWYWMGNWLRDWDLDWVRDWYLHWPWNWHVDGEGVWNRHWAWNWDRDWPWNYNLSVNNHKLGRNWDGEACWCTAEGINDQTSRSLVANEADADAGVRVLV